MSEVLTTNQWSATVDLAAAEARQGLGPRRKVRRRPPKKLRLAWRMMEQHKSDRINAGTGDIANNGKLERSW